MRASRRTGYALLFLAYLLCQDAHAEDSGTRIYTVEMGNKIIGYSEETRELGTYEGKEVETIRTNQLLKLSLLQMPMDQRVETVSYYDPHEDKVVAMRMSSEIGPTRTRIECAFSAGAVGCDIYVNDQLAKQKTLALTDETVIPWGSEFLLSRADSLVGGGPGSRTELSIFYLAIADITGATLEYESRDVVRTAGSETPVHRFLLTLAQGGSRMRYFISDGSQELLRVESPDSGVVMNLAEAVIADKLKRAEITDTMVAQVDVQIADVASLTYMKVRAQIATPGGDVGVDSLNVPGQVFTGTVANQVVDGVFEISYPRYRGEGAPRSGAGYGSDPSLQQYLEPEPQIESDHAEIVYLARSLSEGSEHTWETAVRAAQWIHANIRYDIPGGGSALNTLRTKLAECGGHSRLHVALCRAAGIPARLVTGAMYTPVYGGSFGQHAWVEVYMGSKAGWVPLDATAGEVSFVDSGHIRLGESVPFRPRSMAVLDYAPKAERTAAVARPRPAPYPLGQTSVFHYLLDGTQIGTETLVIEEQRDRTGRMTFHMTSASRIGTSSADSETVLSDVGSPLRYMISGKAGELSYRIDCEFEGSVVHLRLVKGEVEDERSIKLPNDVLFFDNNNLGLFAMMLSRFDLAHDRTFDIHAFHPSSLSVLPLSVEVGDPAGVVVRGTHYRAYPVAVRIAGQELTMYVTEDGALVKDVEQGGRLVIEYEAGGPQR